jgi:hypothetical protein
MQKQATSNSDFTEDIDKFTSDNKTGKKTSWQQKLEDYFMFVA